MLRCGISFPGKYGTSHMELVSLGLGGIIQKNIAILFSWFLNHAHLISYYHFRPRVHEITSGVI